MTFRPAGSNKLFPAAHIFYRGSRNYSPTQLYWSRSINSPSVAALLLWSYKNNNLSTCPTDLKGTPLSSSRVGPCELCFLETPSIGTFRTQNSWTFSLFFPVELSDPYRILDTCV